MGTAGELPKAPEKKILFAEDMTEATLNKAVRCWYHGSVKCIIGARKYCLIVLLFSFLDGYSCRVGQLGKHLLHGTISRLATTDSLY